MDHKCEFVYVCLPPCPVCPMFFVCLYCANVDLMLNLARKTFL